MALNITRRGFTATGAATIAFSYPDLEVDADVAKSDYDGIDQAVGQKKRTYQIIETQ